MDNPTGFQTDFRYKKIHVSIHIIPMSNKNEIWNNVDINCEIINPYV